MLDQLKDKTVALTGAASGIGLATARVLASRGAHLSLADVQEEALVAAKSDIEAKYPQAQILIAVVDVRDYPAVEAWIENTVKHFGHLDGAANLAGVIPKSIGVGTLAEQDFDEWDFVQGVNLTGVMYCLKAQLRNISDGGSIVNASSIGGVTGRARNAAYSSSKHGVLGLTRSAAKEVGLRQIRVNAVCPIETPMLMASGDSPIGPEIAMRRKGKPEEVAKLIAFLLSDESTYISGAAVSVDGGWNC